MNICELIEIKRKEKGYTKKQMANLLGYSESAYDHWEKGRRQWVIDIIVQVCEILDLELILNKNGVFIMEGNKMCKVELDVNQEYIEVVADYENHKIVKVYAEKERLEIEGKECFNPVIIKRENVLETLKEAIVRFGDSYKEVYGIVDKRTAEIIDGLIFNEFYLAESFYYKYYAPVIETFEEEIDGSIYKKEVIYVLDRFKIARPSQSIGYYSDIEPLLYNVCEAGKEAVNVSIKMMNKPFYLCNKDNKHYNMAYFDYNHFIEAREDIKNIVAYELFSGDDYLRETIREDIELKDIDLEGFIADFEKDTDRYRTSEIEDNIDCCVDEIC